MSKWRYRFTAYSDEIPAGHGPSIIAAQDQAASRLLEPHVVTHVVMRLREYPFTRLATFPPLPITARRG